MQDDPLYAYAKQIVDEKGDLPAEVKQSMLNDILDAMNTSLDAEILTRLTPTGFDEFNKLLDTNPSPEVVTKFIEDSGIDIQNATVTAMTRFKKAYYGEL